MTTGRINQVSAYHPQPAGPQQKLRGHKWHLHKGFVRSQTSTTTRAVHQRVAYPFESKGKAQSMPSACLIAQTLPGKQACQRCCFQSLSSAQKVQMHKPKPCADENLLPKAVALVATHNRSRMGYLNKEDNAPSTINPR